MSRLYSYHKSNGKRDFFECDGMMTSEEIDGLRRQPRLPLCLDGLDSLGLAECDADASQCETVTPPTKRQTQAASAVIYPEAEPVDGKAAQTERFASTIRNYIVTYLKHEHVDFFGANPDRPEIPSPGELLFMCQTLFLMCRIRTKDDLFSLVSDVLLNMGPREAFSKGSAVGMQLSWEVHDALCLFLERTEDHSYEVVRTLLMGPYIIAAAPAHVNASLFWKIAADYPAVHGAMPFKLPDMDELKFSIGASGPAPSDMVKLGFAMQVHKAMERAGVRDMETLCSQLLDEQQISDIVRIATNPQDPHHQPVVFALQVCKGLANPPPSALPPPPPSFTDYALSVIQNMGKA